MFPVIPLTAEAEALKNQILAIPRTDEPIEDELPHGLPAGSIERLYDGARQGAGWVIPELKKFIARYPEVPVFKNYLKRAYQVRKQRRQEDQVLKDLARLHPDYLFTRIALALRSLESGQAAKVAEALGLQLDITRLYPERTVFHFTELMNYYYCVAVVHARGGQPDLALGIQAALDEIDPDAGLSQAIFQELMRANVKSIRERMDRDEAMRIEVPVPPLSTETTDFDDPSFCHDEIHQLYERDLALPADIIHGLLALPRETLLADLIQVLDDAIKRTPDFMAWGLEDEEACAPLHALHFLAEISGVEALEVLLRFFSLHPDALDFWLGDMECSPQIARIIDGGLPRVSSWLKSPGISTRGKSCVANGMVHLARSLPSRRDDVVSRFGEVLTFLIASPREDMVLDTRLVSFLVCNVIDLCATELLPCIREAWENRLIEEFITGDLDSISKDLSAPPSSAPKTLSIIEQYRGYYSPAARPAALGLLGGDSEDGTLEPDYGDVPTDVGRNDPCPCGSGKKYKKCCIG